MDLIEEIRNDLLSEAASLTTTLRKAKVLASEISLPEFREWVDFELGGYPRGRDAPAYRSFRPTNLGTLSGPFGGGGSNVPLATHRLPEPVKEFAERFTFRAGVGELEALISDVHERRWPAEYVILARDHLKYTGGSILIDAYQPIPPHVTSGILDQVKNKLLDFIIGLQENNVTSDNVDNEGVAAEVARNLFIINIYGDRNVVASGEKVHQEAMLVNVGDIESLVHHLRALGIGDDELDELHDAVLSEPEAENGQLGPKVAGWLGRLVSKAASGALDIGVDSLSREVMHALMSYYG